jgi:hypothetical protein
MDIKVLIVCCALLWVTYWRRGRNYWPQGSSKNVILFWRKSDSKPLLSHFVKEVWSPFENDVTNLWPTSHKKMNCLKKVRSKHLPVRTILHHKNNVLSLGLPKFTRRLLHIDWSITSELPNWSVWNLASSAQDHISCIKTFLTSRYFDSAPTSHYVKEVSIPAPPRRVTPFMNEPIHVVSLHDTCHPENRRTKRTGFPIETMLHRRKALR